MDIAETSTTHRTIVQNLWRAQAVSPVVDQNTICSLDLMFLSVTPSQVMSCLSKGSLQLVLVKEDGVQHLSDSLQVSRKMDIYGLDVHADSVNRHEFDHFL